MAAFSQCKPVSDQSDLSPIADVDWSKFDNIINMEELENDSVKYATHHTSQPLDQVASPSVKKRKRVPLTVEEKRAKRKIYKQRYKAKIDSDPVKKDAARKRTAELHKLSKARREEAMTEEERYKFNKAIYTKKKSQNAGFSSRKALDWHTLRELEASGKANEAELEKLNKLRRIDRETKKKYYQRKKAQENPLAIHLTKKFKKGQKN